MHARIGSIYGTIIPRDLCGLSGSGSGHDVPRAVVFSKDRRYVALGTLGGYLFVWRVSDGVLLLKDDTIRRQNPSLGTRDISDVAFSANGSYIAVATGIGPAYEEKNRDAYLYIYRRSGAAAPAAAPQVETPIPETALLSNYPNPFNPETWIPYQLAESAEVTVTIHAADGKLVRRLELGQLPAGVYQDKDRAAYWDGKNELGERVASGVYFYTLTAGDFSATKKMLIRK